MRVAIATCLCAAALAGGQQLPTGDPCLPADLVGMMRGESVDAVARTCKPRAAQCSDACREALERLKGERCFAHITRPQPGTTAAAPALVAMQGTWYALYPASGLELVDVQYGAASGATAAKATLRGTKMTGNQYVRAGRLSWEATATSCSVVSSLYAGAYTPRWDPCELTMHDSDHMTVSLGGSAEDDILLVRATAPLLFGWEEHGSPLWGFAAAFDLCGIATESGLASTWAALGAALHGSGGTVVLDQALLFLPLLLLGGVVPGVGAARRGTLLLGAAAYSALVCARLRHLGWIS